MRKNIFLSIMIATFSGLILVHTPAHAQDNMLRILNWTEYIAEDTISNFEERCGCSVEYTEYEVEEAMLSKLQFTPKYYDIVISSTSAIAQLILDKQAMELDLTKIPNHTHVAPKYTSTEDNPNMMYAVPYLIGTTGLAYRTDLYGEQLNSWKEIFEPQDVLKEKIILLEDRREVIGAALKYLGYSMNSENNEEIGKAVESIRKIKPFVYTFTSNVEEIQDSLLQGDAIVALMYSGDALALEDQDSNITYVIPEEGVSFYIDSMAILQDAPHVETAYQFINYILEPEVGASLTNELYYASPNSAAKAYIAEEILQNPSIYPSEEVLEKMEIIVEVKNNREYNKGWRKIIK